jgi:hypothetical protein
MDPSQATPRETLRKAIDSKIESLEGSIRALRRRRNELAPISSLPTEIIEAIFSLLHIPGTLPPFTLYGRRDHLAWLRVAHVCHHWREVALNQPLFWSYVDFSTISSAGAAEILARAKKVPLHLEAKTFIDRWDNARFDTFRKQLQAHVSHIRHLDLCVEPTQFMRTLESLTSPAPTLESLRLFCKASQAILDQIIDSLVSIPDTLFGGTTPKLSCLELYSCAINWKSPLLRGLEHLGIYTSYERPSLSNWLDALDEMPQLKTLTLAQASPISPFNAPLPSTIKRTVTIPSLTLFDITSGMMDCGLALAHLVLPALTTLCVKGQTRCPNGSDVLEVLPYVTRHTPRLHHTKPLQCLSVHGNAFGSEIVAWSSPSIDTYAELPVMDVQFFDKITTLNTTHAVKVAIHEGWNAVTRTEIIDTITAALPLDGIVMLAVDKRPRLDKQFWFRHGPQWPLLQCMLLGGPAASAFREMLLEDNEGCESPLFPLLTKLVLFRSRLSGRRTLRLCDALMNRVEQGVPLEILDLRTCFATRRVVELLSEIVTEVLGPENFLEETGWVRTGWDSPARGLFAEKDSSEEDYYEDDTDSGNGDEVWDDGEPEDDSNAW